MKKTKKQKKAILALFFLFFLFFSFLSLLSLPFANASFNSFSSNFISYNSIPLLAVRITDSGYEGSPAMLYLEIRQGKGRVFLDTYPLTKLDTQMSVRFAKEIACNYLGEDCSNYDFIYTIKANAPIVGGPSAGAASTILTISSLLKTKLREDIAITGTINSGGVIGSVSEIKAKIDAAKKIGLKKVLIPKGSILKQGNKTQNLTLYASNLGIELKEVSNIQEAFYEFSGMWIDKKSNFTIDKEYIRVMKKVADMLCSRTKDLDYTVEKNKINLSREENETKLNLKKAEEEYGNENYYSSASLCYTANIAYRKKLLNLENLTIKEIMKRISKLRGEINDFENKTDKKSYKTLTELETYIIIKERLRNSKEYLDEAYKNINDTRKAMELLVYAEERLNSAYSWSLFYNKKIGKPILVNKGVVKNSCMEKLMEAQERYEYVNFYFSSYLEKTGKLLERAREDMEQGDYELCLFRASKAKAESDAIISLIGINESFLPELIEEKIKTAREVIAEETEKGIFPIVGYSYYEYANTLKNESPASSLLYIEYSLELSNLDLYFEKKLKARNHNEKIIIFITGLITGVVLVFLLKERKPKKTKKKTKRTKNKKRKTKKR